MNNELKQSSEADIIKQKQEAWGKMGVVVHNTESALNVKVDDLLSLIVFPGAISDIPEAEQQLKGLKKDLGEIDENVKKITARFNEVATRLRAPGKRLEDAIKTFEQDLIKLKKEQERILAQAQERINQATKLRKFLADQKADIEAEYKTVILKKVNASYEYALNNISADGLPEFLGKVKDSLTDKNFLRDFPDYPTPLLNGSERAAIAEQVWKIDPPSKWVELFHKELAAKYVDFEVALKNKEKALALSAQQSEAAAQNINLAKQQAEIGARMDTYKAPIASDLTPSYGKALKRSYALDMPETVESVLAIMAAFAANLAACMQHTGRITKWLAFTPAQAGAALAKLKTEDNNFAPQGITFKEVDKL